MTSDPSVLFPMLDRLQVLREYHDVVRQLTGMPFHLLDREGASSATLADRGDYSDFCRAVHQAPGGLEACRKSQQCAHEAAGRVGKPIVYRCHAGLTDLAVPVYVEGQHVATMASGQGLSRAPSEAGFEEILGRVARLGIDVEALREAYFGLPVVPSEKLAALGQLLALIARYIADTTTRASLVEGLEISAPIRRAQGIIQERYTEPLCMSDVAREVYLSPSWFAHRFKRETGITFRDYLEAVRLHHARRLLRETDLPVTRIALEVGFESAAHFSRRFKAAEGIAPLQFRKTHTGG